ncbi:unnamed protein product [Lactuca saligna]|uniref:Uncharacterized protein n=1 Tax=Lactuca saligna TaxID=75948 RepID=A0AA36EE80_LACSI|nr:unnamed protein product [Lactuca saligna]
MLTIETTTTTVETSIVTTTIKTFVVTPPQPTSPPPTSVTPPSSTTTFSPTFVGVIQEPIATLFSSQSTEPEKTITEAEADDDDVMVSFVELQFNLDEDDILDDLIMSGKQFKILNSKMNSILHFLADTGDKNSTCGVEVEYLLKSS